MKYVKITIRITFILYSQVAELLDATELICKRINPQRNENTTVTINGCGK